MDECTLRTADIGRPEPPPDVLDKLERDGHDRNGFCETCWGLAYKRSLGQPMRSQSDHYLDILAEVERAE